MNKILISALGLALLIRCGGGGGGGNTTPSPTIATALAYTDPSGSGYRLTRNPSLSDNTRLVLDLRAPTGTQAKGVAFFLSADGSKVDWVSPSGSRLVAPGNAIPLGNAPHLLFEQLETGQPGNIQVGLFQKGGTATQLGDQPILSVALRLKAATPTGTVAFSAQSGTKAIVLNGDGHTSEINIQVGALKAQ